MNHKFCGGCCLLLAKEKDVPNPTIYYEFKMEANDPQTVYYKKKKLKNEEKAKYGIKTQIRKRKNKTKSLSKKYNCPLNITPLPLNIINSKIMYTDANKVNKDKS